MEWQTNTTYINNLDVDYEEVTRGKGQYMSRQEIFAEVYGGYWSIVKNHVDDDGWFPDSILGESIWVLSICEREYINGQMCWRHSDIKNKLEAYEPKI